jgi:hypothetical protein
MKITALLSIFLLMFMAVLLLPANISGAGDVARMETQELKAMIGQPGLTLVDARTVSSWKKSDKKITGAIREDAHNVSSWAGKYSKDGPLVVYCS